MHQAEEIIEHEFATPDPYADFDPAARAAMLARIQAQAAAKDADQVRANRHERRRAAALGRKR